MAQYIDKNKVVAEIEKMRDEAYPQSDWNRGYTTSCEKILSFLDILEVKEMVECKQPEYSCFETTYKCGKKPHWNIGDTLAFYEFYSDREGECVLGKVTRVKLEEDEDDWFYTFEDGSQYDEASLLEEKTYKKN